MKPAFRLLLTGLLLLLFFQCSTNKETYVKDFEKFITVTEKKITELSDTEWEEVQTRFNEYCGKYYDRFKEKLTSEEKIKIGLLKSKFSAFTLKREANKLKDLMKKKE